MACMGQFNLPRLEIVIQFAVFTFNEPNMLTDLSDSVCQYGGLVVQFDGRKQQYAFCESLHHYKLHSSNKSFTFIVVWFSGYSQGELKASISGSDCRASHSVFYLSESELSLPYIVHRPTFGLSQVCEIFTCQALQNHHQRRFTLQLGPHSLGTVRLSIIHSYTLSACDPEVKYDHGSEISLKSMAMDNWPLHLNPKISHRYHNITDNVVVEFDYLHMANISLGYICKPNMTRLQMAVLVQQSTCRLRKTYVAHIVINKIPSLCGICNSAEYIFLHIVLRAEKDTSILYIKILAKLVKALLYCLVILSVLRNVEITDIAYSLRR